MWCRRKYRTAPKSENPANLAEPAVYTNNANVSGDESNSGLGVDSSKNLQQTESVKYGNKLFRCSYRKHRLTQQLGLKV